MWRLILGFLLRTVIYGAVWWGLTAGAFDSWQVGLPFIAAAICVDYSLSHPIGVRWSPVAWVTYALYFLKFSLIGGVDVLRRVYHPRLPLNPDIVSYPLRLSSRAARVLFVCTVSLLPGTVSVQLCDRELKIHVLDTDGPFMHQLGIIENRVAALFHPYPAADQTAGELKR